MENDLISVIVPVYNMECYLEKSLETIVNQSYHNLQIILVNDGSTDGSLAICQKYAKIDNRIQIISQRNKGVAAARNTGLAAVRGNYIGYIDPDDFAEPNMIMDLYRALTTSGADISVCGYEMFGENGRRRFFSSNREVRLSPEEFLKSILTEETVGNYLWNKLYKAALWENIRFSEGKIYEDLEVMYQLVLRCNCVQVIPAVLYHYRQRLDSLSNVADIEFLRQQIEHISNRYQWIQKKKPCLKVYCETNLLKFLIVNFNQIAKNRSDQWGELQWYRNKIRCCRAEKLLEYKYKVMYWCIIFVPKLYACSIHFIYQKKVRKND